MQRTASTLARGLAVATALPLLLAGCSGSPDPEDRSDAKPTVSKSPSPTLAAARFTGLPAPCKVLAGKTVRALVPESKDVAGDPAKSSDTDARGSCAWNGLDGFQYRWLEVSFERLDTVPGVGSAEDQAKRVYTQAKASAAVPEGLKKGGAAAVRVVSGVGDEAQLVSAAVRKDGEDYRDVSVVARKGNVVMTVSYDGAGFEGDKPPGAGEIEDGALKAAKEAFGAIR